MWLSPFDVNLYQEHETQGYAMPPPRYTRGGFPSVQALEPTGVAMESSKSGIESVKKSLFSQQFEAHGPSYFGVEPGGREQEPVTEGEAEEDPNEKASIGERSVSLPCCGQLLSIATMYAVLSSLMQNVSIFRLDFSSLISGVGLVSVGVSLEAAKDEVIKIHEENVERLSSLSEEEIKKERERIQQQIG